jgi:hypothetical protein
VRSDARRARSSVALGRGAGQRRRDVLQSFAFGRDGEEDGHQACGDHQARADAEREDGVGDDAVLRQFDEEQRPRDAARSRADGAEERDGHGAGLHGEDHADRRTGGAGTGGGENNTTHRQAVIVVAFSTPAPNSHAVPKSSSPDRTYVPAIGRRPAVSKRRPSSSGPRKLPKARSGR